MHDKISKSRKALVSEIGANRLTKRNFETAIQRRRISGFCVVTPESAVDRVLLLRKNHPLHEIVHRYAEGERVFSRDFLESAAQGRLESSPSIQKFSEVGIAFVATGEGIHEIRIVDPAKAQLVNAIRFGHPRKFSAAGLIQRVLRLPRKRIRSRHVNDARRLQTAFQLQALGIDAADLLDGREQACLRLI